LLFTTSSMFSRLEERTVACEYDENGRKHGLERVETFFDGRHILTEMLRYRHGKLHGPYECTRVPSGVMRESGRYVNGKEQGPRLAAFLDDEGRCVVQQRNFHRGEAHGSCITRDHFTAQILCITAYKNDEQDGHEQKFYSSGELQSHGLWRMDYRHGVHIEYYRTGSVSRVLTFFFGHIEEDVQYSEEGEVTSSDECRDTQLCRCAYPKCRDRNEAQCHDECYREAVADERRDSA
jgi:antitoxin component YwqK of YwqJK toxin-antitoxin module